MEAGEKIKLKRKCLRYLRSLSLANKRLKCNNQTSKTFSSTKACSHRSSLQVQKNTSKIITILTSDAANQFYSKIKNQICQSSLESPNSSLKPKHKSKMSLRNMMKTRLNCSNNNRKQRINFICQSLLCSLIILMGMMTNRAKVRLQMRMKFKKTKESN